MNFETLRPKFETFQAIERVDIGICRKLLNIPKDDLRQHFDQCSNEKECTDYFNEIHSVLLDFINSNGEQQITYSFPKKSLTIPQGNRMYANKGVQRLLAIFRGALMSHTTDIDMKNSAPTILRWICQSLSIRCVSLDYYIHNRDEILNEFPTRNEGKKLFLKSMNTGYPIKTSQNQFFKSFDKEMKAIQKEIFENRDDFKFLVQSVEKDRNQIGCALNKLLVAYENYILQECVSYLQNHEYDICTLMFDGVMVYGNHYDNTKLLIELSKHIETLLPGIRMTFTFKPHDTSIDLDEIKEFDSSHVDSLLKSSVHNCVSNSTDANVAQFFKDNHPNKYAFDSVRKVWYELDTYNKYNLVCYDRENITMRNFVRNYFKDTITNYIYEIRELLETNKGGLTDSVIDDCNTTIKLANKFIEKRIETQTSLNHIMTTLTDLYADSNIDKNLNEQVGIFAFNNMVYDCSDQSKAPFFRPIEKTDYVCFNTGYDYNPEINQEARQRVLNIIRSLFEHSEISAEDIETDIRQFLVYKASTIPGDRGDKYQFFQISQGKGGNGKSFIDTFDSMAYGSYFITCESVVFTEIKENAGPNPGILRLIGKRMISTSEVPSGRKLSSSTLKRACGDKMDARECFGKSFEVKEFYIRALINFNINNTIEFSENDGGIYRRFKKIDYPISFVDEVDPANPYQRKKDLNLMSEIRSNPALRLEYMRLIIESYETYLHGNREIPKSQRHDNAGKAYLESVNPIATYFTEGNEYTLTYNKNDCVIAKDFKTAFDSFQRMRTRMSKSEFEANLRMLNLECSKCKKRDPELRDKVVIYGVKLAEIESQIIDDSTAGQSEAQAIPKIIEKSDVIPVAQSTKLIEKIPLQETAPSAPRSRDDKRKAMRWTQ